MRNRWYELTPDVCIVISKIECAKEEDRTRYAKLILSELRMAGYEPNRQIYLDRIRSYDMRRWYDKNIKVSHAIEYLRLSPKELRRETALKVLDYLEELKKES
jgi:hypothetical protein